MLRAELKIFALIEHYADGDEMAEHIQLFTRYPDALEEYQKILKEQRDNGLLERWGVNGVIDEGEDYIAAQDPERDDYVKYHYKLYIAEDASLYVGNLKAFIAKLKREASGTDAELATLEGV